MLKYLGKGLSIMGLVLTCWMGAAQANEAATCGKDGKAACDVTFSTPPSFIPMCVNTTQTQTYTITNNTPVTLDLTYIKVLNPNGTPATIASVVPVASPNCGSSLAAGASCNIGVEVDPTVAGTFGLLLEVGVNSSLVKITERIRVTVAETCTADFETIPLFTSMCSINAGGNLTQTETFTIRNDSSVSVAIDSITLAKLDLLTNSLATLGTTTCGSSLAAGATCDINVNIPPQNTVGTLIWELDVVLAGIGKIAAPINVVFSNTCALQFSAPFPIPVNTYCGQEQILTYIVKNNTTSNQTILPASITLTQTGPLAGDASIDVADSTCSHAGGLTLIPGASCTVVVDILEVCLGATTGTFPLDVVVNVGAIPPPAAITTTITAPAVPPVSPPAINYLGVNGTACAVLAGTTVTNVPAIGTVVTNGDVCVSAGTAITGFGAGLGYITPPGTTSTGSDTIAVNAQAALTNAINTLSALPCHSVLTGQDLGGQTLIPGVYCFNTSAQLTGDLSLAATALTDVFVIQIGSTLTTASNAKVLTNSLVNPANVYWVVGSSATLGTNTTFIGNILADISITMNAGASLADGRALASTGAVTLSNNAITAP